MTHKTLIAIAATAALFCASFATAASAYPVGHAGHYAGHWHGGYHHYGYGYGGYHRYGYAGYGYNGCNGYYGGCGYGVPGYGAPAAAAGILGGVLSGFGPY